MADSSGVRMPKACRACAKAKARCDRESDETCKRCHRLGKECGGQAPGAHRRQKPTKNSVEVSALEAKLDRMVALLAASNPSATQSSDSNPSATKSSRVLPDEDQESPSEKEGELLLEHFSTKMVHLFPFIVIPTGLTAEKLRQEKPFLFLNLAMVACQDASRQREFSKTVKEYVAEHIVLRSEQSLDLLQGLLVFLAWFIGHSPAPGQTREALPGLTPQHFTQGPAQLDAFMQLALGQLVSLHLAVGLSSPNRLSKPMGYVRKLDALADSKPLRTLEERRTYLGCYYLNVMLSSCVRDTEPLRFKKYTDECCKIIEVELESPTDAFLVHLVRTMHLADRIVHTICFDEFDYPGLSGPLGLSIRGFEPELRKIKTSFSCESPYSNILNLHYDTLEILLYQAALSEELSDAECSGYTLTRLDILYRCLQATKSFFNGFNSLSAQCFFYLPFTIWCQFGHAVVALSRLSLFQSETGWDLQYVQDTIDFDQTIDRIMLKLEDARQLIEREFGPRPTAQLPEAFGRLPNRMRLMKECHRQRKEALDKSRSQEVQDPVDFDFLFNMSFDPYFPFDDFLALGDGVEIPQNL